jgi:hypothetical protein
MLAITVYRYGLSNPSHPLFLGVCLCRASLLEDGGAAVGRGLGLLLERLHEHLDVCWGFGFY